MLNTRVTKNSFSPCSALLLASLLALRSDSVLVLLACSLFSICLPQIQTLNWQKSYYILNRSQWFCFCNLVRATFHRRRGPKWRSWSNCGSEKEQLSWRQTANPKMWRILVSVHEPRRLPGNPPSVPAAAKQTWGLRVTGVSWSPPAGGLRNG